ncbi:Uncharacterized protein dnl_52490 [Desulfonema limicola]|uniref:Uncharacterized protein n=1 Tax=Desulfonema limicola TaxID=45656 RepID=A0A975BC24_9BACT|nr:hypothetical protein [Desulfonema limicola]QTA82864.1 Uncharacterized protein dnl_52490 [Desulfonema limicola]
MNFRELILNDFSQNAKQHSVVNFNPEQTDSDYDPAPFEPGQSYCRIWLVEMCLQKNMEFFKTRYPVVHSAIRFNHGDHEVAIPYIAGPGFLKELAQENLDRIIQLNHALTPLFPFNHGTVELQAGLFSMEASDWINKFINTLGRFSKLLPVPELSSVMHLAAPVYSGIEDLMGISGSRLELGCRQTFSSTSRGNMLKPGYFAVILADQEEVENLHLCIVSDQLRAWQPKEGQKSGTRHKPLEGYSYMLFHIEKRDCQEWEALTRIKNLVDQAVDAVLNGSSFLIL